MSPVVKAAQSWVGKWFRRGQVEQCAQFVRAMFEEAGVAVGVAKRPSDWQQTQGMPQGPAYANSFAGDEVGARVKSIQGLIPGDIVMFADTYGDFPEGTITHVGIYVGNGQFVHRPTSSRPVERAALAGWWADRFAEGRRVSGAVVPPKPTDEADQVFFKMFAHGDRARVFHRGSEVLSGNIRIDIHSGKIGVSVNGRELDVNSLDLELSYRPK